MKILMCSLLMLIAFTGVALAGEERSCVQQLQDADGFQVFSLRECQRDEALRKYEQGRASVNDVSSAVQTSPSTVAKQGETNPSIVIATGSTPPTKTPASGTPAVPENNAVTPTQSDSGGENRPEGQSNEAYLNKKTWGSFPEVSIWGGGWRNFEKDTQGFWFDAKYMLWLTQYRKPENFGVGLRLRGDYGWMKSDIDWGYIAPGATAGYFRGINQRSWLETDVSLLYRIDMNRNDGLMPAIHAEYDRILDYKNRLVFQVDGSYFPGDSWLGPGIYWENKLNKKWKVMVGAGASLGWLDGDFFTGFQPSIKFKYRNRFTVGLTANLFTGLGPFGGFILAYDLTPDINTWYETNKANTVKLQDSGQKPSANQESSIHISDKPIKDMK